jgi:hypothetical protein
MSEETSDRTGTELERQIARKVSGRGGTVVIAVVLLALTLLMAFNMN